MQQPSLLSSLNESYYLCNDANENVSISCVYTFLNIYTPIWENEVTAWRNSSHTEHNEMLQCVNTSDLDAMPASDVAYYQFSSVEIVLWFVVYGIISFLAVCGNALVVYVVLTRKKLQNVPNYFIVNLAVCSRESTLSIWVIVDCWCDHWSHCGAVQISSSFNAKMDIAVIHVSRFNVHRNTQFICFCIHTHWFCCRSLYCCDGTQVIIRVSFVTLL